MQIKILLSLLLCLCGCSYMKAKNANDPLTQQEQLCSELERNIIFNTASTPGTGTASSTQYNEMTRLYSKSGCDKLEK
jgi:hypothetical protein